MAAFHSDALITLRTRATVEETVLSEDFVRAAVNTALERAANRDEGAATDPVGANQKPRMLHLSAWMCHEGAPNLNGAGFLAADLEAAVQDGLFAAPYFGMIDWNHDFTSYGVWYKAEYAYDAKAQAYGILAHGAVFAWRYGEIADKVLAQMARQGWVDVSMSCMAGWYEPATTAEGKEYRLIRKPVFFTTSLLDVDPADPFGHGVATEDPASTTDTRTQALARAATESTIEDPEMNELIEKVMAMFGEHKADLAPLVEAALQLPGVQAQLETVMAQVTELTAATRTAETAAAEAQTLLDAAKAELAVVMDELTTLRADKAARDAEVAAAAEEARKTTRMAQVPDSVVASLNKNPKKDDIVADWMRLDEAQWTLRVESFSVPSAGEKSLADRTAEEGALSTTADVGEGSFAITRWRKSTSQSAR